MIEYKSIFLPVNDNFTAKLVFKKFNKDSDWICLIDSEFMENLEELSHIDETN